VIPKERSFKLNCYKIDLNDESKKYKYRKQRHEEEIWVYKATMTSQEERFQSDEGM
jgi:hypothetical protein